MSRQHSEFEPTHVLVVTADDTAAEVTATNDAIRAALDHADAVDVWVDLDLLDEDHPSLGDSVREAFTPVGDGRFRGDVVDFEATFSELLGETTFHRFVTLERLAASRGGETFLSYVPDHRAFGIDSDVAPGLDGAVREAVENEDAALLPAGTLVDWYCDGTHYELSPPHLCVDGTVCHDLSRIVRVQLDDRRREIGIEWEHESTGLLSRVLERLGPSAPDRFTFDSEARYQAVAERFRELGAELGW